MEGGDNSLPSEESGRVDACNANGARLSMSHGAKDRAQKQQAVNIVLGGHILPEIRSSGCLAKSYTCLSA